MSRADQGEIAILVEQIAAVEGALAESKAERERLRARSHKIKTMLAEALIAAGARAIAAARPDPAAKAEAPAVSVILPVHDRAGAIGDAVRSVLAQSFAAWELIVVDDGSGDAIEAAMAPFLADPRIRFLRQARAGAAAARNRALASARGALIAYLDSDNWWFPEFLAAAVALFAAEPEAGIAYAGLVRDDGAGPFLLFHPFDRARLLARSYIDTNVIVHRRALYERLGGFDETLTRADDYDLVLRYTAHRPAAEIPAVGAYYRRLAEGPRISRDVPLAPNLLAIRRKWRTKPARAPRVLYVASQFPQLSESHIYAEIACMRRFGAAIEVWAPAAGASPFAHDLVVHRGRLADAIRAARPDLVHVHWFTMLDATRATVAASGLPLTLRGHSFDATPQAIAKALLLANLRRLYLLPGSASGTLHEDERIRIVPPIFDSTLFPPSPRKDRRLVLRASPGIVENSLRFMLDLATLLPEHRVVVAVTAARGHEPEPEALEAYRTRIGSPAELRFDVQRPEIGALFAAAGIYVHSSTEPQGAIQKRVGGPVSLAEAMATGAYVLARNHPALAAYVGGAGATYADAAQAAALIRATAAWTDAEWREAHVRSVERAYATHADETALAPVFEDWCAIAAERDAARAVTTPAAT